MNFLFINVSLSFYYFLSYFKHSLLCAIQNRMQYFRTNIETYLIVILFVHFRTVHKIMHVFANAKLCYTSQNWTKLAYAKTFSYVFLTFNSSGTNWFIFETFSVICNWSFPAKCNKSMRLLRPTLKDETVLRRVCHLENRILCPYMK